MKVVGACLCAMLMLAGACSQQPKKEDAPMNKTQMSDDERLIERVRDAARARVAVASVEAAVGQKPLINTTANYPNEGLRRVEFQDDPDFPSEVLVLADATAVVYWSRPIESKNPRVVGVQYRKDGSASVFFAAILPD
jgi:hypothetical protein